MRQIYLLFFLTPVLLIAELPAAAGEALRVCRPRSIDGAFVSLLPEGLPGGVGIEVTDVDDPVVCADLLEGGLVDAGLAGDLPFLLRSTGRVSYRVLARVQRNGDEGLLVWDGAGIKEVRDLRGKRIAVYLGGRQIVGLRRLLAAGGLTLADVRIVEKSGPGDEPGLDHAVDAVMTGEPWVAALRRRAGDGAGYFPISADQGTEIFFLVRSDVIARRRTDVLAALRALIAAETRVQARASASERTSATKDREGAEPLAARLRQIAARLELGSDMPLRMEEELAALKARDGTVSGLVVPDLSRIFDPEPLREVDPSRVRW